MHQIEIISVHYKTPDLIYQQYQSVRNLYPELPYRIIDGSDNSEIYFQDLESGDPNFIVERFGYNIHHGPGMHHAITTSKYDFLLILDSDVSLRKPVIEQMMEKFSGYATGKLLIVNKKGKEKWQIKWWHPDKSCIYQYVHPYCMLINKQAYLRFKPFIKHGAPCIEAMMDLHQQGKTALLEHFNIEDKVNLVVEGTRSRWGMNLK